MKRICAFSVISLAVLGGTQPVLAQSTLNIYGRMSTTLESTKLSGESARNQLLNNGSNIGFLGEEDLGGGTKAGFQLEMDVDSSDGSAPDAFTSQSEVWLSGNWGRVRLGNYGGQSFKTIVEEVSLHNDNVGTSADWLFADIMPSDNHVSYVTPEIGGLVLELGFSSRDDRWEKDGVRKNAYELIANYDVGDWSLAASYADYSTANQTSLRALYTVGDFQFGGYWQRDKNGWGWANDAVAVNSAQAAAGHRNTYRLMGVYNLGSSEFHVNVGYAAKYKHLAGSDAKQWTLGWNYNLSKRTKVYAHYTKLDNGRNALYGEDVGVTAAGQDMRSLGVGLRHNF